MPTPSLLTLSESLDTHAQHSLLPSPQTALGKALAFTLRNTAERGLPPIEISPLQGQYLAIQSRLINAKNILEIGTLGGYSTIWFASTDAHVTSLEINPKHKEVAVENVRNAGFEENVEIILGPALETLPKLVEQGKKFDLVFIDADWGEQWEYFQFAVQLGHGGTCIYADNVVREVLEAEEGEEYDLDGSGSGGQGKKETLISKVGKMDDVQATLVSVLSSHKGRESEMVDGFVLAVVL